MTGSLCISRASDPDLSLTSKACITPGKAFTSRLKLAGKLTDWRQSIRKTLTFDRTAVIGLVLLLTSFVIGALLRKAVYITNEDVGRLRAACDTYLRGFCVPTAYFFIPLGSFGSLVINVTSFLVSAVFFILGVLLVRK